MARRRSILVVKTQPERLAKIRRMAALPGSGVRADQVLATAQAFDKLIHETDGVEGVAANSKAATWSKQFCCQITESDSSS